jgi:octopine/nopaline transport system permease protein
MTRWLKFRRIVAPLVLRFAVPGLGNVWQVVLKETALISVTGLVEILRQAQVGAESTRQPFLFFGVAALLYLAISSLSGWGMSRAEQHFTRGMRRA